MNKLILLFAASLLYCSHKTANLDSCRMLDQEISKYESNGRSVHLQTIQYLKGEKEKCSVQTEQ